ncbi:hypothetical protein V1477_018991 [Vespula maculifrons]|uniref:NADH dehydrogenase subunit 4L n=1 Tax=Vespula maculifrons TaxID=7453 RepID=A0ABD2AT17_VESMC
MYYNLLPNEINIIISMDLVVSVLLIESYIEILNIYINIALSFLSVLIQCLFIVMSINLMSILDT